MNNQDIQGVFDKRIDDFIQYKRNMGYKYCGSVEYQLEEIKNLLNKYSTKSGEIELTKEAGMYVLSKKERYQKQTYASLLREFSRYLNKTGETSYTLQKKQFPILKRNFKPYIYSREKINELMRLTDTYSRNSNLRKEIGVILPFIMRLIYGCGLRVSEALHS